MEGHLIRRVLTNSEPHDPYIGELRAPLNMLRIGGI
jgi:hypothetical protein